MSSVTTKFATTLKHKAVNTRSEYKLQNKAFILLCYRKKEGFCKYYIMNVVNTFHYVIELGDLLSDIALNQLKLCAIQ